jgi:ubiquinone/menaquinone biosynthesis C-methylase UbiE
MDIRTIAPLVDLGQVREEWRGILSPRYADDVVKEYVHRQFLQDASTYAERYNDTTHWKQLLAIAQRHCAVNVAQPRILDIGSGAGNSVMPLLELYPGASIVASDLSVPLLQLLKSDLIRLYPDRECILMQLNAEQMVFDADQFDLVCGGSILHHLLRPELALSECHRVLKSGGAGIFFEPFELGNQVLAVALKHLIEINSRWIDAEDAIPAEIVKFFRAICADHDARKGRSKPAALLAQLDDKHLFTKTYFETTAPAIGFTKLSFEPLSGLQGMFSSQARTLLRLGMARLENAMPDWAWDYLREIDEHFSEDLRSELSFEFCIILEK